MSLFRLGRRSDALRAFEAAHERFPESAQIAFSLAQEYDNCGRREEMLALFEKHRFPDLAPHYVLAQARYCYLWGAYNEGQACLAPLIEKYFELGIADTTFLYLRGMPFFGETWAIHAALCELSGDLASMRKLTERACSELHEIDLSHEREMLSSLNIIRGNLCARGTGRRPEAARLG